MRCPVAVRLPLFVYPLLLDERVMEGVVETAGNNSERATRTAAFASRYCASIREHILIGKGDLFFEQVQLGIAIHFPPFAVDSPIARLCLLPTFGQRLLKQGHKRH